MNHEAFMQQAIDKAREGAKQGNTPFGACIVKGGKVISCGHNQVWADTDITAHAEVVTIRDACRRLGTVDLSGTVLYSTCEPCPMCFSAIHWANISKIIFGARIEDALGLGFNELVISNLQMKKAGKSPVEVEGPFMLEENLELFKYWDGLPGRKVY
ncbi:MAG: nucleoside deaminase [Planctomycetota bacterium]